MAEYESLKFIIEDAAPYQSQKITSEAFGISTSSREVNLTPGNKFRIRIKDKEDSSFIPPPPMKQVKYLVLVIENKPKSEKIEDTNKKLFKIRE
jgi:hypothetical protein